MPSALETLVKILKLEREQGYKNTAVIGGLSAFAARWSSDAHTQARKPEHHLLVDELSGILNHYDTTESRGDRHNHVTYMLDRITGRVPAPPEFQVPPGSEPPPAAAAPPQEKRERPPRENRERSEPRPAKEPREQRQPRENKASRETDYAVDASQPMKEDAHAFPHPPQAERQNQNRPEQNEGNKKKKDTRPPQPPRPRQPARGGSDEDNEPFDRDMGGSIDDIMMGGRSNGTGVLDIPVPPRLASPPRKPRAAVELEQAAALSRELLRNVVDIKGIGPKMAETLAKLGITTIRDLIYFLPRRHDDYTQLLPIRRLEANMQVTVIGTVQKADVRVGRSNRKDFYVLLDDGTATMGIMFFGQGNFLGRSIKPGNQLVVRGITQIFGNKLQMSNPEWEPVDVEHLHTPKIVPVYPLTEGLSARMLRKQMQQIIESWSDRLIDYIPEDVLERADLGDLSWTIRNLHFPESFDHLTHAKRRFVFDQLLTLQLAILANRRVWQSVPAEPLHISEEWLESFLAAIFPYPLTGAQRRAIDDIRADIARNVPMNRLLQGDVGSGKTAVALTLLAMAIASGKQAAIMAPTGILAEQHFRNMQRALDRMPMPEGRKVVVALLTGSISSSERQMIYNGLADGSIDLVVGTHAIIQDGVQFHNLGAAVIDEQHRFGVEQRGALRGKGGNPHLLVMTATPIPRTLALTMFADLDLSVIDEMPPGRIPIQTRVIEPEGREKAYNFIESQLEKGRQAFVIYPLVEASDRIDAESAVEAFERLKKIFYRYRVGLLHGRMKPQEKDEIMASFSKHEFDVMVTTSVAEVGVDIPNASVIVIDGANRFGLAQLHQFRGRVGRGGHASYCLLVCDTPLPEARERLTALEQTSDGFKLAEIDWQIRGPGDLIGTRQSGASLIQLADAITPDLVTLAQREARTLYEIDPELSGQSTRLLAARVQAIIQERSDLS